MKMKLLIGLLFSSGFIINAQTAQKIGLNPTMLDNSAILEVESTTKGFLPPRMTTEDRGKIDKPAVGLVIYNTTTKKLEIWDGISWSGGGGGAGDNLGDHIAIKDLDMGSKNITNVNKISTTSAQISKGTDGGTPTAGQVATAADANGNIIWRSLPLPRFHLFIANSLGYTRYDLRNYLEGGEFVYRGTWTSVTLPNFAVLGATNYTNYTIVNHTEQWINFETPAGSYFIDGTEYAADSNPNNFYKLLKNTTIRMYYAGNNQWYTY